MLKRVYKILTVIITIFWGVGIILFATGAFQRVFLYPKRYAEYVEKYCEIYGAEQSLAYGIIKAESNFNAKSVSKKDAKGLMQITQSTANFIANRLKIDDFDIFDEETNIRFGCWYLSYLFIRFERTETVVAAYNAGESRVAEWLNNKEYSLDGKSLIFIPFNETRKYVEKVMRYKRNYSELYAIK